MFRLWGLEKCCRVVAQARKIISLRIFLEGSRGFNSLLEKSVLLINYVSRNCILKVNTHESGPHGSIWPETRPERILRPPRTFLNPSRRLTPAGDHEIRDHVGWCGRCWKSCCWSCSDAKVWKCPECVMASLVEDFASKCRVTDESLKPIILRPNFDWVDTFKNWSD